MNSYNRRYEIWIRGMKNERPPPRLWKFFVKSYFFLNDSFPYVSILTRGYQSVILPLFLFRFKPFLITAPQVGSEFRGKLKEILNINSSIGEAPPWYVDCPTPLMHCCQLKLKSDRYLQTLHHPKLSIAVEMSKSMSSTVRFLITSGKV